MGENDDEFLTAKEFAAAVRRDHSTVLRWVRSNKVVASQPMGKHHEVHIAASEVDRLAPRIDNKRRCSLASLA